MPKKKRAIFSAKIVVSPHLSSALDRTNVSKWDATYILHVAATSYGQDSSSVSLSVSNIGRRTSHHVTAAAPTKAAFIIDGHSRPSVIHFDGKLLPSITGGPEKRRSHCYYGDRCRK